MKSVVENCEVDELYMNIPPDARAAAMKLFLDRFVRQSKLGQYWTALEKEFGHGRRSG